MPADAGVDSNRKNSNVILFLLLAGILVALVFLCILMLVTLFTGEGRPEANSTNGGIATKTKVEASSIQRSKPKAIQDSDRVRGTLKEGREYRIVLRASLKARVVDKAYAVSTTVTNMAYLAECVMRRKIEKNDGRQVVELRTFSSCRTVKCESEVEEVRIDLGKPGEILLEALDFGGNDIRLAKSIVEAVLQRGAQYYADETMKVWPKLDSLSGKQVRIVYVDGQGVQSIEPVDCNLTEDEFQFLSHTSSLADYYLLPDLKLPPGKVYAVKAQHLSSLIDPSLRAVPMGEFEIKRKKTSSANRDPLIAELEIQDGSYLELDSSNSQSKRVGSLVPRGTLQFNVTDGYLESAMIKGDMKIEQLSKDHLLFETSMRTTPQLEVQYKCELLE